MQWLGGASCDVDQLSGRRIRRGFEAIDQSGCRQFVDEDGVSRPGVAGIEILIGAQEKEITEETFALFDNS